jgi:hypothetical protein
MEKASAGRPSSAKMLAGKLPWKARLWMVKSVAVWQGSPVLR